jgi:outer membrane protein OmpA-like peptidoglycan-associated protein
LAGKKEKRVEQNFYILSNEESATTEARFTKTSPGSVYVLRNIYFETGSTTPSPESEEEIRSFANFLKKYNEVKVAIGGHTDNVGDPQENKKLSQERAESIRQILINKHEINAGRVTAIGYGDTRPMATNDDEEEGRELNRRIDATILE